MGSVSELHHPGVTGHVTPVNPRQADALMRSGWRPVVDDTEPDPATPTGPGDTPEES